MASSLNDLARAWRERAALEETLGGLDNIIHRAASRLTQRKLRRHHIEKEAEHEGARLAYLQAATELEAALRGQDG